MTEEGSREILRSLESLRMTVVVCRSRWPRVILRERSDRRIWVGGGEKEAFRIQGFRVQEGRSPCPELLFESAFHICCTLYFEKPDGAVPSGVALNSELP